MEQKVDAKPIAPGMTMFIGVENNAYKRHCPDRKLSILTDRQILIMKKCPQAGMALGAFMLTGSVIQKGRLEIAAYIFHTNFT